MKTTLVVLLLGLTAVAQAQGGQGQGRPGQGQGRPGQGQGRPGHHGNRGPPSKEQMMRGRCLHLIKTNQTMFEMGTGRVLMQVMKVLTNETRNALVTNLMQLDGAIDESGAYDFDVISQAIDANIDDSSKSGDIKDAVQTCITSSENEALKAIAFNSCFIPKCGKILGL